MENFIKITKDAWLKGWHERNGGNLTYRLTNNEIQCISGFISEYSPYSPIGVKVANLANQW